LAGPVLIGCASDAEEGGPPLSVALDVSSVTLDNGLEVVTVPNATAPVVTALVGVRAGSAVEGSDVNGYSHLFEHMMFQGSTDVPDPHEYQARLNALGALSNATTSVDRVTYFFTAPSSTLDPALSLLAGALQRPALDATILEKEKGVVIGEFDLNESQPDFLRYRVGLGLLYGADAVRLDPLGSRSAVTGVSPAQLRAMHDRYYVPNNSLLIFSGDLSAAQGRELAERHFGAWPRGEDPLLAAPPPAPEPVGTSQYSVMSADVAFTSIDLWWPGPSVEQDREGALAGQLLSRITSEVDHSFRRLVASNNIFSAVLAVSSYRRAGYVQVQLGVLPGQEAAAFTLLRNSLGGVGEPGNVSAGQLEAAQDLAFRAQLVGDTTPDSVPGELADAWGPGDWQDYLDQADDLYEIDTAALTRFARTYLRGPPRVTVLMSSPENLAGQGIDAAWLEKATR
jgi:zinc protease